MTRRIMRVRKIKVNENDEEDEIGVMGENVRLQSLQMKSLEYSLERTLEKIERKIETLCKVQFEVLEKITGLKSVENEIKALSESVGGLESLKRERQTERETDRER